MKIQIGLAFVASLAAAWCADAQSQPRILTPIDERATLRLTGNVHPLARAEFDAGAVPASQPLERMILVLTPDPATQNELDRFVADQHDPASAEYHRWLTPEEYGRRFGIADADLNQITGWLSLHGFTIEEVSAGRRTLVFSGTARLVEETFRTSIHYYRVNGKLHQANSTEPEIPQALAGVVAGIASLHDFLSVPQATRVEAVAAPEWSSGGSHYLAPADFATIYDLNSLYSSGTTGSGQSIAVVARSNINLSDVQTFRTTFGLPINNPVVVLNGANPGVVAGGEQDEATLDAEWAGAVAKSAAVKFVVSASTSASDGVALSAQYIVNHNLAPVMTTSFGLCEQASGSSYNQFWNSLWQQAAAQGITSLVAAGDGGAAGCDAPSESKASGPLGVNAIASPPYAVGVGGTGFNDQSNPSQYWSPNNTSSYGSALTYIPEVVWNQSGLVSGGSGLWAGSGGASTVYTKPAWQTGAGVPAANHRYVPDVSLAASGHDGYLIYMNSSLWVVSGTSAASPAWAGVMALINQHSASTQGNANTVFYPLMTRQFSGGTAVFHDIVSGNNSVPGLTGFTAGTGYDECSGIGSPDGALLVQHWSDGKLPSLTLGLSAATATAQFGAPAHVTATTTIGGAFKSAVALSVTGLPSGLTASWSPSAAVATPGAGSSTLTLTAAANLTNATYTLTITATGQGITVQQTLKVTVTPPFQLTPAKTAVTLAPGAKTTLTIAATAATAFTSSVTLGLTGLPAGVTAAFSPTTVLGTGAKSSTLTLTAASTAKAATSNLSLTGSGGGATESIPLTLTITNSLAAK